MRLFRRSDVVVLFGGVLVVLAVLVLAELGLRAFWPQRSDVTLGMFRVDPHAGYSLRPEYRNEVRLPEYSARIRIDPEGYRVSDEDGQVPAGGSPRLLAIGDSFTFGVGVDAEDAYPLRLQGEIAERSSAGWVVRNGGVGGYGPLRSARLLEGRQGAWRPEAIVHVIAVGTDLEDPRPGTYLVNPEVRGGRLVSPGRHPLASVRIFLRVHSHLYAFLRVRLHGIYRASGLADRARYLEPVGLREWPEGIEAESWPAGLESIAAVRDWCAERGVPYLVAVAPTRWQVDDAAWGRYRRAWGLPESSFDRDHATRVVMEGLAGLGVDHLDLLPAFRAAGARGARLYYAHDSHWTADGHALAAAELAREIEALGWTGPEAARRAVADLEAHPGS